MYRCGECTTARGGCRQVLAAQRAAAVPSDRASSLAARAAASTGAFGSEHISKCLPGTSNTSIPLDAYGVQPKSRGRKASKRSLSVARKSEIAPPYGIHGLPVHDVEDLLRDPFLEARSFFAEVELPEAARSFLDVGDRGTGTPPVPSTADVPAAGKLKV